MMRALTNIQTAVNRPLRERLRLLILAEQPNRRSSGALLHLLQLLRTALAAAGAGNREKASAVRTEAPGWSRPGLIDRSARRDEVRLEAHRVGDPQELLVAFQKLEKIAKRLESLHYPHYAGRLCAQLTISPAESIATLDGPKTELCRYPALVLIRSSAAAPHVRSRRYCNCSDNDQPDEDSSGHEIHIQALEALSACCHDCRYGQKAPTDNKRDKGFQCEHQRPALNCPKKIRG